MVGVTENMATSYDESGKPLPPRRPKPPERTLPGSFVIDCTPEDIGEQIIAQGKPEMQARLLAEYRRSAEQAAFSYDLEEIAREFGLGYGPPNHGPYGC